MTRHFIPEEPSDAKWLEEDKHLERDAIIGQINYSFLRTLFHFTSENPTQTTSFDCKTNPMILMVMNFFFITVSL